MCAGITAFIIIQICFNTKSDEAPVHEWIEFPELETLLQDKITKTEKYKTSAVRYLIKINVNQVFFLLI